MQPLPLLVPRYFHSPQIKSSAHSTFDNHQSVFRFYGFTYSGYFFDIFVTRGAFELSILPFSLALLL